MSSLDYLTSRNQGLADERWNAFVASRGDGHLLQLSQWGALKCRFGWQAERIALVQHGEIIAGAQLLVHRLPWGQKMVYVPKGPLVNWHQPKHVKPLLDALAAAGQRWGAAFIKLEPDLLDSEYLEMLLTSYGLCRGHPVQPRSTIHVPLQDGAEAVLAGMKQKWRYNVRLANRKGISIRQGNAEDVPAFNRLVVETGQRDGFGVHEPAYYEAAFRLFAPDGIACWLLAEYQEQLLAAIVVFALGDKSWYLWGASSDQERQRMPNHRLQWAGMEWAMTQGCKSYDLWGVPDEVGQDPEQWGENYAERHDGLWGVYRFKQGFGGHIVRYVGGWDIVLSPLGYRLYGLARRTRGN